MLLSFALSYMNKLILFGYSVLCLLFVVFSYLFIDSGLSYLSILYTGFVSQNRFITTVLFVLIIFLFFLLYAITLYLIKYEKIKRKELFLLIGVCAGVLFFSYPAILSFDIFNYIATAKVVYFYHENPYVVMPIEFLGDPLLLFMHASNKIALYGPAWIGLSSIPHYLGFNNFLITLFSFKLFVALFYFGSIYFIFKISKSLTSVALFALNPLVLIETLVSSHNDIVMVFLALVAFYFLFQRKNLYALLFLISSIFIKYATVFLIPVFLYVVIQNHFNRKIQKEKVFIIAACSMFVPFIFSFLREEIYPWYAIWFLIFACFIPQSRKVTLLLGSLSFGLMLRYTPFMLIGTHFGNTPILKILLASIPVGIVVGYLYFFKKNK